MKSVRSMIFVWLVLAAMAANAQTRLEEDFRKGHKDFGKDWLIEEVR